jgi:hypothetical protein
MITNKKGVYFTLMTISILSIFLFYFIIQNYKTSDEKMFIIETRVLTMNNFITDVQRDIKRGAYIASYRALLSLEEYVAVNGEFLDNLTKNFKEAFLNGTINNVEMLLMINSTFKNWVSSIKNQGEKMNINTEISYGDIKIFQEDPWSVKTSVNVSIFINDTTGIASFQKQDFIVSTINIIGFEDPLYIVNGLGRLTNTINITPYEDYYTSYNGSHWNVTNLSIHNQEMYYTNNSNAPSFLFRFENKTSSSPYGIESLVYVPKLSEQALPLYDKSIVDYIYWSNISTTDYRINYTPEWFKLDQDHLDKYQVQSISY